MGTVGDADNIDIYMWKKNFGGYGEKIFLRKENKTHKNDSLIHRIANIINRRNNINNNYNYKQDLYTLIRDIIIPILNKKLSVPEGQNLKLIAPISLSTSTSVEVDSSGQIFVEETMLG